MAPTFLQLIDAVRNGSASVAEFASSIEHEWNFGEERSTLSEREGVAVQKLFDIAVYYSPLTQERARIPNYRDERDVLQAAKTCREALTAKAF